MLNKIEKKLKLVYGNEYNDEYLDLFKELLTNYQQITTIPKLSEKTTYLITYGDIISDGKNKTLDTLNDLLKTNFGKNITDVHLLPMFEYTSDDGFSVVDYMKVDPLLGDWENVKKLAKDYNLMFDFVANHISQASTWFQGYLNGEDKYKEYFIPKDDNFDYSKVVRPRTSDLVSTYDNGKTAWTTFSKDQVDINYRNIDVLLETTKILLEYVNYGATSIRLDAIGFLWKESSTTCIHLDQTHEVVKLWRIILDAYAPNMQIITETNVPHLENISYFGDNDEAHQVYQFALPPLTLHTFINQDSTILSNWAKGIDKVSDSATFFNFLASHDGIGMRPTEGILDDKQRKVITDHVEKNGAKFNYKTNTDGSQSVYEMNVTYFDAIKDQELDPITNIDRLVAAHGILMSMVGVPAIYYHSLLGSTNYYKGVEESGINRRINRRKFTTNDIEIKTVNENQVLNKINQLLDVRCSEVLFNPYNAQEVLDINSKVFAIKRIDKAGNFITCLINISSEEVNTNIKGFDIVTNNEFDSTLAPYQVAFIK